MLALDQILRLPLLPLLLLQGLSVRRRALILPEPDGQRQGQTDRGQTGREKPHQKPLLRLLIAGDSSAAGVGVATQDQALSGRLVAQLAPDFDLHWQLEATTGHKTSDTLAQLATLPHQKFDVVVLALGVNDVTSGTSQKLFSRQQSQLLQLLDNRFTPELILTCGVPQMQLFPALPQPLAWALGRQSARLDSVLAIHAERRPDLQHLPFQMPQDPELAAEDGYHPSAQAYQLWASLLTQKIHDSLKRKI